MTSAQTLPYMPVSEEIKAAHEATMRAANVPLAQYHDQALNSGHNVTRRQFYNIIVESAKGFPKSLTVLSPVEEKYEDKFTGETHTRWVTKVVPSSTIIEAVNPVVKLFEVDSDTVSKILAVRAIEYEIMCSYSRLFSKWANGWCENTSVSVSFDDLYDECIGAAMNSVVAYTDPAIKFSTYVSVAVKRQLSRTVLSANPLSTPSPEAIDVINRYYETRRKLNRKASYDDIVDAMKLDANELCLLKSMMVTVINQSALEVNEQNDHEDRIGNDYAALGNVHCGLDGAVSWNRVGAGSTSSYKERTTLDPDMVAAIENANLTELERAVLEGFVANGHQSDHRNQGIGDAVKDIVNPKTGKPYSRMMRTFALRNAKKKIQAAYSNVQDDEEDEAAETISEAA